MGQDNIQLKDANLKLFGFRAKDTSAAGDGSVLKAFHLAQLFPVEYGSGGSFHLTSKSASMAAGLAANSPIYAFRWNNAAKLALVKKVSIQAWSLGTGFAAGLATFDMFRALGWSAADTGGVTDTITGDNGNLRTSMPGSILPEIRHSSTATLTAGTRTLDNQAIDTLNASVGTATNTVFQPKNLPLFDKRPGDHPLVLAQNEGFVIQATVPATGVWGFAVTPEWEEVDANLFPAA